MRGSSLKINFAINVAGALAPLLIALVTVPIYVSHIGAARYGVLAIVWLLLGYFGFLDLGLSRAAANTLSKIDPQHRGERMRVLATALSMNAVLGVIGGVALGLFGYVLLQHLLKVPTELRPEIAAAFPWIAVLLPLGMVNGVGVGALESRNKFLEANVLQLLTSVAGQIPPVLAAVYVSPSLSVVIPVAVVCRALSVAGTLGFVYWIERSDRLPRFDSRVAKSLLTYGGWISVSGLLNPILATLDQLVLAGVLGVATLTYYAIPMTLVTRSQIVPYALIRTVFPTLSRIGAADARDLSERSASAVAYGYGAICAPAILLASPLLSLWMGADFAARAAPVAQLLVLGAWVNGLAMIPYNHLQAQGRPNVVAKFHLLELLPFIVVLWVLTSRFGLIGAAAAWTLRVMVDALLLYGAVRLHSSLWRRVAPAGLIVLASVSGGLLLPLDDRLLLACAILAGVAMAGSAAVLDPTAGMLAKRVWTLRSPRSAV